MGSVEVNRTGGTLVEELLVWIFEHEADPVELIGNFALDGALSVYELNRLKLRLEEIGVDVGSETSPEEV